MYRNAEQTIAALRQETEQFYHKVDTSRRIDESFSCADDEPLTEDEITAINEYWGKYSFAYPNIDYKSFQTFKNRSGRFDVRHCPGAIRTSFFTKHFVDHQFSRPFQHKVMLPFLYPDIRNPELVGARMDGILYDGYYNPVTSEQLVDICREKSSGGLIIKPVGGSGGKGITVLSEKEGKEFSGKNLGGGGTCNPKIGKTKPLYGSAECQQCEHNSDYNASFQKESPPPCRTDSDWQCGQPSGQLVLRRFAAGH